MKGARKVRRRSRTAFVAVGRVKGRMGVAFYSPLGLFGEPASGMIS